MAELDKLIIKHLDDMDAIEDNIEKDIERLYQQLDIDKIILDPETELTALVAKVQLLLAERYHKEAAEIGFEFAENVKKDGEIEITKSDDPKLNADLELAGELDR